MQSKATPVREAVVVIKEDTTMADMQSIAAEVLQMERGVSSDKQHLTAVQFKNQQEELRHEQNRPHQQTPRAHYAMETGSNYEKFNVDDEK